MTTPKAQKRGPPKPTPAQRQAVIKMLLQGHSWHRAVKESVAAAVGLKLRTYVFQFRADPEIQTALIAEADKMEKLRANDQARLLLEIEEGMELARDEGNYLGIMKGVMAKADLLGLNKSAAPDDFTRLWEKMTGAERLAYIADGTSRLIDLRTQLEKRGLITITQGAGSEQGPQQ